MHGVQSGEGGVGETVASFIVESSWESASGMGGREAESGREAENKNTHTGCCWIRGF